MRCKLGFVSALLVASTWVAGAPAQADGHPSAVPVALDVPPVVALLVADEPVATTATVNVGCSPNADANATRAVVVTASGPAWLDVTPGQARETVIARCSGEVDVTFPLRLTASEAAPALAPGLVTVRATVTTNGTESGSSEHTFTVRAAYYAHITVTVEEAPRPTPANTLVTLGMTVTTRTNGLTRLVTGFADRPDPEFQVTLPPPAVVEAFTTNTTLLQTVVQTPEVGTFESARTTFNLTVTPRYTYDTTLAGASKDVGYTLSVRGPAEAIPGLGLGAAVAVFAAAALVAAVRRKEA